MGEIPHYCTQASAYSNPSQQSNLTSHCEQVIVYDARTQKVRRTYARFKDKAYSGTFRQDGKLLLAGGEDGIVQVSLDNNFGYKSFPSAAIYGQWSVSSTCAHHQGN